MLSQFNEKSGHEREQEQQLHLSDQLNERLMTAEGLDNYWKNLSRNPDYTLYDNDRIGETYFESHSEEMGIELRETLSATSGKANGQTNSAIAETIDKHNQRYDGSVTTNISGQERVEWKQDRLESWNEEETLALQTPQQDEEFEFYPPSISDALTDGPDNAVAAIAVELADRGIEQDKIDEAMKVSSGYEALENLKNLAVEEGADDVAKYNNDLQNAYAEQETLKIIEKMKLDPPTPQQPQNEQQDYNQQLAMSGP